MPISEIIVTKIEQLDDEQDFKDLLISILTEEDKGNFRFKNVYENLINEYLKRKEDDSDDKN